MSTPRSGALPDQSGVRGVALSHLIGFAIAIQFLLDRAVSFSLPYNRFVDLPIRLILVWLILDRVGRKGRFKLTGWDVFQLFFVGAHGVASIYADLYMSRDTGLFNFFEWGLQIVQPYFYFIAVREGLLRKGFRPDILLNWIIGVISVACVIAMLQALNPVGMRHTIDTFYHQREAEMLMEGPSAPWQARGVTAHANAMAMLILVGFIAVIASASYRKWGWFELLASGLMLVTLFATYSRTGIATMVALSLAFILSLFFQKKYREGFIGLGVISMLLVVFLVSVEAFNIQRYQVFTKGVGVVRNEGNRGLWGLYQRQKVLSDSVRLMEKFPITGVSAASAALNKQRIIIRSAYNVEGLLLNVYGYSFVSYGMYGIVYLCGLLGTCLYQLRFARGNRAFAGAAFFAGVVLLVSGISENTLFTLQIMVIVNCVMALALTKLQKVRDERADPLAALKTRFLGATASSGAQ